LNGLMKSQPALACRGIIRPADFDPAWWLPGPHLQTLWGTVFRRKARIRLRRERVELPDGDFIDLDWTRGDTGPVVMILHGLEGSSESHYVRGLLAAVDTLGWRGVVVHFRGCSGEPNRLDRGYNAGETRDLAFTVELLRRREPDTPVACVGYSLGGNALLKWLGETGARSPLRAAVAVSVPFLLEASAQRLNRGVSRLYQRYLIGRLKRSYQRKFRNRHAPPVSLQEIDRLNNFHSFDDRVTAPLHGYDGVQDYYDRASSRRYLSGIQAPTLIVHSLDDPFFFPWVVPEPEELAAAVTLELSTHGGHVGFVGGANPWRPAYWLERRIPNYLAECFGTKN
jgi:predicted alpha/beta-fold hydrolase